MQNNKSMGLCLWIIGLFAYLLLLSGCRNSTNASTFPKLLQDSIHRMILRCPGSVGVAIIVNNHDTITVNNNNNYPMMSVFKLHQALATCNHLDKQGVSIDSVLDIQQKELDPNTWSPMMKEHKEALIRLSIRDLLCYALIQSDNNSSNILFDRILSVENTDLYIASLLPRKAFKIAYTESEIAKDHGKAYANFSTPLATAILINRLFTERILSEDYQSFIKETLTRCMTGEKRIASPLLGKKGVSIVHKTGSGYRDKGILAAHNDAAYITLPNGTNYTLIIFTKDFRGSEAEASRVISQISAIVYKYLT